MGIALLSDVEIHGEPTGVPAKALLVPWYCQGVAILGGLHVWLDNHSFKALNAIVEHSYWFFSFLSGAQPGSPPVSSTLAPMPTP